MFVLRTPCLCGLNLGCALEDWLSRWRQRLHVRSLISGWRWALGLECSLLFCSSPWPATSGRRTKSRILVFGGIQPPLFFSLCYKLHASLSLCSDRLEYKYSKLVMSANKECELPAADSCAIMEGEGEENEEDEVVYANKSSLLAKLKAIATKVS